MCGEGRSAPKSSSDKHATGSYDDQGRMKGGQPIHRTVLPIANREGDEADASLDVETVCLIDTDAPRKP